MSSDNVAVMVMLAEAVVSDIEGLRRKFESTDVDRLQTIDTALEHAKAVQYMCRRNPSPWECALIVDRMQRAITLIEGLTGGVN